MILTKDKSIRIYHWIRNPGPQIPETLKLTASYHLKSGPFYPKGYFFVFPTHPIFSGAKMWNKFFEKKKTAKKKRCKNLQLNNSTRIPSKLSIQVTNSAEAFTCKSKGHVFIPILNFTLVSSKLLPWTYSPATDRSSTPKCAKPLISSIFTFSLGKVKQGLGKAGKAWKENNKASHLPTDLVFFFWGGGGGICGRIQ